MVMAEEKKEKPRERKAKPRPEEKKPEATPGVHAAKPVHEEPKAHAEAPKPHVEAPKAEAAQKPKRARVRKKGARVEIARGKRKTSVARATVREGHGRIRMNSILTSAMPNRFLREMVEEPLRLAGPDGNKVDVDVSVYGGGESGQAQAARTAVARALAKYFGEGLEKSYEEADKYLLNEDPRRVEPKKYKGRKARARFQKSYR